MATKQKQHAVRAKVAGAQLEKRAQWVIDRWDDHPSLRYNEMVGEVRRTFDVGKTAGEDAIKRANEILREMHDPAMNPALTDRIASSYWSIYEGARAEGNWRAARAALDSLRRHLGIGAADRLQVTTEAPDFADMTDEQVAALASLDQQRKGTGGKD